MKKVSLSNDHLLVCKHLLSSPNDDEDDEEEKTWSLSIIILVSRQMLNIFKIAIYFSIIIYLPSLQSMSSSLSPWRWSIIQRLGIASSSSSLHLITWTLSSSCLRATKWIQTSTIVDLPIARLMRFLWPYFNQHQ